MTRAQTGGLQNHALLHPWLNESFLHAHRIPDHISARVTFGENLLVRVFVSTYPYGQCTHEWAWSRRVIPQRGSQELNKEWCLECVSTAHQHICPRLWPLSLIMRTLGLILCKMTVHVGPPKFKCFRKRIQLGQSVFGQWHNFCDFASIRHHNGFEMKQSTRD